MIYLCAQYIVLIYKMCGRVPFFTGRGRSSDGGFLASSVSHFKAEYIVLFSWIKKIDMGRERGRERDLFKGANVHPKYKMAFRQAVQDGSYTLNVSSAGWRQRTHSLCTCCEGERAASHTESYADKPHPCAPHRN